MKNREKRIFVYGGPQVFYAAKERPSGHPNAPAYVIETEHLRVKAQRDKLLEAAQMAVPVVKDWIEGEVSEDEAIQRFCEAFAAGTLDDLRAAIAECEGS